MKYISGIFELLFFTPLGIKIGTICLLVFMQMGAYVWNLFNSELIS